MIPDPKAPAPSTVSLLIVDDEAPQMKALCDTLRSEGYRTTGFSDSKAALDALRTSKFDLVLTDLMMPGMDGISFLRAAQLLDPHLVGIVMTGQGTVSTAVEAMQAGALDYVLKPFKLSAIVPVLARALTVRKLRLRNAELEQRVRERTTELESANQELAAFSYSVSHDLRAPLRAVSGFSDILVQKHADQLPPEARHYLQNVLDGARQMEQLIDGLLRLARLGRQALSPQPVNIVKLVNEVLDELQRGHPGRQVDIHIGDLPGCTGDLVLLKQVFVNLLSNAYKFTGKTVHARIEIDCRTQDGAQIYFVRDNGAGFDMQYADKLFGVFQRLHRPQDFDGTGVGLSIVQRIIQRHGGRIWAEGAIGQGATFYFTLSI